MRHSGLRAAAATKNRIADAATKPQLKPRDKHAGGQMAHFGARIAPVDGRIHQPVERHGGGARAHHRDYDPGQLSADFGRVVAAFAERQQRPGEGEGQGEDRVLELDHVEREAQAFPEHRALTYCLILPPYAAVLQWRTGGYVRHAGSLLAV